MRRDRFLFGILVGIGLLIVAALVLFFIRSANTTYVDDNTPQGVAHNYFLAIHRRDYQRAYGYIMESAQKPDFDYFQQQFVAYNAGEAARTAVEIGEVQSEDNTGRATVRVFLIRPAASLFEETSRSASTVSLVLQDGQWGLQEAPYPFWVYR